MWINSSLGKWEQDIRVSQALHSADWMRAQEEAGDAGVATGSGGPLEATSAWVHWLAARTRGAVESFQTSLAAPAARQDECL